MARHPLGVVGFNTRSNPMRNYKTTAINCKAFTLTLEGTSLNSAASRLGMSAGRVRYALHSECELRCPKLFNSLIKSGMSPSLAELRRHCQAFLDCSDIGGSTPIPRKIAQKSIAATTDLVHVRSMPISSRLSRMFNSIFG